MVKHHDLYRRNTKLNKVVPINVVEGVSTNTRAVCLSYIYCVKNKEKSECRVCSPCCLRCHSLMRVRHCVEVIQVREVWMYAYAHSSL
jgi:hypothetical protein